MLGINKKMIDKAFRAFLIKICCINGISLYQMTLVIRILDKGKILLHLCRKDVPQTAVNLNSILPVEMIGLRYDSHSIEKFFRVVHHAFMKQLNHTDPLKISLVLYESTVSCCACLGVMENEKAVKVLMVSDILQAIELGSEQLN